MKMSKLWLKHRKFMKGNAGFSLVELIIVIAIMAALVAILAPQYIKYVEKSRESVDISTVDSIVNACKTIAIDPTTNTSASYGFTVTWDTNGGTGGISAAVGSGGADTDSTKLSTALTSLLGSTVAAKSKVCLAADTTIKYTPGADSDHAGTFAVTGGILSAANVSASTWS